MKLFIGCSSSNDIPEKYLDDCKKYLSVLLNSNNELVFGACNQGIMGLSYEIALKNRQNITGICPDAYKEDLKTINCSTEIITKKITERTDKLIETSDALIFLPGGIGTIHELITAIESKRSNEFDKPIIIYNSHNFFNQLLDFLNKIYKEKFTSLKVSDCYHISDSIEDTLEYLNNYYSDKNIKCLKK